jgi:TRAP-type C4-dicarboxylate transport system permease small subunit
MQTGSAVMNFFDRVLRPGANWLAAAGLCLLFLNSLAIVADVLLRALLSSPIDRLSDVSSVVYILSAACCIPAATANRRHITIRAFEGRVGPRGEAALEAFASLCLIAAWSVITYQLWLHAHGLALVGQTLSQIQVPVAPFWYFVAACLSFTWLVELAILAQWLRTLVTGTPVPTVRPPGGPEAANIL